MYRNTYIYEIYVYSMTKNDIKYLKLSKINFYLDFISFIIFIIKMWMYTYTHTHIYTYKEYIYSWWNNNFWTKLVKIALSNICHSNAILFRYIHFWTGTVLRA